MGTLVGAAMMQFGVRENYSEERTGSGAEGKSVACTGRRAERSKGSKAGGNRAEGRRVGGKNKTKLVVEKEEGQ